MIRDMRIDQLKIINWMSVLFLDIIVEQLVYIREQIYLSDLFDPPRDTVFPYFYKNRKNVVFGVFKKWNVWLSYI